jgi:SAM-dependent methyltransferase
MREASKTNKFRPDDFFDKYLSGVVLDIGAGNDLVCPHAQGFDLEHGDAHQINHYFLPESFDAVHSSHSLEHMHEPVGTLERWWSLVKPGGYLIVVVPHEDLYEQGIWPSVFNHDHKVTFRLDKRETWSPVSYDIGQLCRNLPGAEVVSAVIQAHNYDRRYIFPSGLNPKSRYSRPLRLAFSVVKRIPVVGSNMVRQMKVALISRGYPLDQTQYDACAQIEVIVRKLSLNCQN